MGYHTYILYSDSGERFYIGCCADLDRRLRRHNAGATGSTKPYRPWRLVYSETFGSKTEARKRELQIKSWKKGEAFKKLLNSRVGTEVVKRG